jgi:hypothetical protein
VPKAARYVAEVEVRVVVKDKLLSGGEMVVGEYAVRVLFDDTAREYNHEPSTVISMAIERAAKAARTMAAGVDNTERNRRK